MNRWVRLHQNSIHNPKVVMLNDRQHRAWHNSLIIADEDGALPRIQDVACHFRMTVQEAENVLCELVEARLLDIDCIGAGINKFTLHDWKTHQYISDTSTDRVRKFRSKNNNETDETGVKRPETVSETSPESESYSDTDTDKVLSYPAAKKKNELGLNSNFKMRKDTKESLEDLTSRAEGLGLPVDELIEVVNERRPKNRPAYFTKLCINRLKPKMPKVSEEVIRAALWGKQEAFAVVCNVLLAAESPS